MPIADVDEAESVLLVGSTLRKEQPLLAARLRQAAKKGLAVHVLHVVDDDLLMPVARAHGDRAPRRALASGKLAARTDRRGPAKAARRVGDPPRQLRAAASRLRRDPRASRRSSAASTGATVGVLPDGANTVGAHLAGAVPKQAASMRAPWSPVRAARYLVRGRGGRARHGPAGARRARAIRNSPWCSRLIATPRPTTRT